MMSLCSCATRLEFVDDYLDIEVVRFGRDKLRVYKHLDPETLDIVIRQSCCSRWWKTALSMVLRPKWMAQHHHPQPNSRRQTDDPG